jgi:hypothetical protein
MRVRRFIILICLGVVLIGLPVFHLGPSLHLRKGGQVMHSTVLPDGSRLILAQKANENWIEAFTVSLYRVYPDGKVHRWLIGFEESYWWLGRLRARTSNVVEIQSLGFSLCRYDLTTGLLTWNDNYHPPQSSNRADSVNKPSSWMPK